MSMYLEQLTPNNKIQIEKNRKNNTVALVFVIISVAIIFYTINFNENISQSSNPYALLIKYGIIPGILIGSIVKLYLTRKRVKSDLISNTKEIFVGQIRKKIKKLDPRALYETYYFCIDEVEFRVPHKIYKQYKDNDVLKIERSPQSHYTLDVQTVNESNKDDFIRGQTYYKKTTIQDVLKNVIGLLLFLLLISGYILYKEYILSEIKNQRLYTPILIILVVGMVIETIYTAQTILQYKKDKNKNPRSN